MQSGAIDPNLLIGRLGIVALLAVGFWRLIDWVRNAPVKPDPWDEKTDQQLEEAQESCPHCSTPQPENAWFCEHCGRAVGPYNNLMPYLQIFSEGEVLRNGTSNRMRKSPLIPVGYFLISVNFLSVALLQSTSSPIIAGLIFLSVLSYWILILKNFKRSRENPEGRRQNTEQTR